MLIAKIKKMSHELKQFLNNLIKSEQRNSSKDFTALFYPNLKLLNNFYVLSLEMTQKRFFEKIFKLLYS